MGRLVALEGRQALLKALWALRKEQLICTRPCKLAPGGSLGRKLVWERGDRRWTSPRLPETEGHPQNVTIRLSLDKEGSQGSTHGFKISGTPSRVEWARHSLQLSVDTHPPPKEGVQPAPLLAPSAAITQ